MDDQDKLKKIEELVEAMKGSGFDVPPEDLITKLQKGLLETLVTRLSETEGRELKLFALLAELDRVMQGYKPDRSEPEVCNDVAEALAATKKAYNL